MSQLGSLTGNAERELRLLSQLNEAVINLEVAALGKSKEFSLTDEQLEQSRRDLSQFVAKLEAELQQDASTGDLYSLGFRIKTGIKSLQDWKEDLAELSRQLAKTGPVKLEDLPILEDVLSLLDDDFADDLRRLYAY
jgi:hypothetical protein